MVSHHTSNDGLHLVKTGTYSPVKARYFRFPGSFIMEAFALYFPLAYVY